MTEQKESFQNQDKFPYVYFAVIVTMTVMFIYFLVGSVVAYFIGSKNSIAALAVTGVGQILILLSPLFLLTKASPLSKNEIFRLEKKVGLEYWLLGFAGAILIQFVSSSFIVIQEALIPEVFMQIYTGWKTAVEELYSQIFVGFSFLQIVIIMVVGAIIPAFAEELLFRGFLQKHLEIKLKPMIAIILTSALFSIIHFNIVYIFPLFFVGIFLGAAAYASQSIKVPILIHLINNSIAIIVYQTQALKNGSQDTFPFWLAVIVFSASSALIALIIFLFFLFKRKEDQKLRSA